MYNLKKKLCDLTQIEDWHDTQIELTNYLDSLFDDVLYQNNIFASIYICIRQNPTSAATEENPVYEYLDVGFTVSEISEYFNTRFGMNYFLYDFRSQNSYDKLKLRIKSIYKANFYKYKKLIETLGYTYNPLYNVDANELYSNMESIGDSKSKREPSGTIKTTSGTEDNGSIGESTTNNYTNPYDSNASSDPAYLTDKTTQSPITTEQSYQQYKEETELDNLPAQQFIIDPQTGSISKSGLYSMAAKDSAFGVALGGAERYYAEKRIRQGNIGVTKSTELIESQRDAVRFNILEEFFRDLEREVVVGIY